MKKPENNKRYRSILETARNLFWKHGLKRVTVEEICREAGVSKMTFYKYFPNKVALAKTVYDEIVEEGVIKFRAIMEDENTSAREKMEKMLLLKHEGSNDLSGEFMHDFYSDPDLGLSGHVEEKSRLVWKGMINDFRKAQQKGWLRKDFKPEGIFIFLSKFITIFNDENLLRIYGTPQEAIMELAKLVTYGIMPERENGEK